ncbi:ABC transporter ATP-binding protein [Fictibacillus nanhaiensis]|uniref:ABC transporter ATP-binding protein n=1 Tax=Fictibacillus nanhaiensis TaxID=742169 RepID=UPI001C95486D|nr:ABC transporter ATP-binding protein [Fictibacillus nanhaiensis]MBY6035798.1 ABC transporter ATP-binding protein [Fictibacillus nanhaiensis]
MNSYIELQNITKHFKKQSVLNIPSLSINKGEIVSIVGPSGTGKSTLLRILAGLEEPDSGQIFIENQSMAGITPQDRPVVYMFQESLLFPHMDLLENVAFGLKMRRVNKTKRYELSRNMMKRVGIEGLESRYPHEISGGQKQRAALARSLIVNPKVLLLDEPFSNLDTELRKETRRWMKRLLKDEKITVLFVTHDLEEAMAMGDRVAIFRDGQMQQFAVPEDLYDSPANPFVSSFLHAGFWMGDRFIPSSTLTICNEVNDTFHHWKAEIVETFFQDSKNHLVVCLNNCEHLITLTSEKHKKVGDQVILQEKEAVNEKGGKE